MSRLWPLALLCLAGLALGAPAARAQDAPTPPSTPDGVTIGADWLVLAQVDHRGRQPFNPDAVFEKYLLRRDSPPPREGESISGTRDTPQVWAKRAANEKGRVGGQPRIAYAYSTVESDDDRVLMAEVRGGAILWVNGTLHVGDVYGGGMGPVPVALRRGTNHVFVRGVRGSFALELTEPDGPLVLTGRDTTKPDLAATTPLAGDLAVVVVNASNVPVRLSETVSRDGGEMFAATTRALDSVLPPLGVMKVPVPFLRRAALPEVESGEKPGAVPLEVVVRVRARSEGAPVNELSTRVDLQLRGPAEARRVTFRSAMDDSVQEYSVLPPVPDRDESGGNTPGLVLSVHGAGVDAYGQARSYSAKPDFWHVAATNRRPFGFDWQDWGRRDAYEALEHALHETGAPRSRVYLTGHSMGGHGTWHIGANDVDGFAAIAPSAGWATFDSYTGRPDAARRHPWYGADIAGDTLRMLPNLVQLPTFVLHGTKDDNVPPTEAEAMLAALRAAGAAPESHFQEGAGHWWNGDAAPGADCVDWPGIFDLFRRHEIPREPAAIDFLTADPGVDARHHWLRIEQPVEYGRPARIRGSWDAETRTATLSTEFARLFLVNAPDGGFVRRVIVDGASFVVDPPREGQWLSRAGGPWAPASWPSASAKRAERCGPFKRAFENRFLLVYGTAGTDEENAELLGRARYDAQSWWYRGNGRAEIMTDAAFAFSSREALRGRNVIVYGNADSNAAWDLVFEDDCPLRAERGRIVLDGDVIDGDALGAVFVHRRRGDDDALAAAFADTGATGTRLGYTLLPFVSGVGYPDYAVYGPRVLREADAGVLAAGWFDHEWRLR